MHWYVEGSLAAWALVSLLCQVFLRGDRWPELARIVWLGADAAFLTTILLLANVTPGPLAACYAVLIAASGLWREARLVWLTTAFCLLGYAILLVVAHLQDLKVGNPLHQVIALVTLALIGGVIAYQVQRLQLISRYYERPM
jgi:hypothetical protein